MLKNNLFLILLNLFFFHGIYAQNISGNLSLLANQNIKLEGFKGFETYPISSVSTDEKGNFNLKYNEVDYGVGYLISSSKKPLFVILSGEDIEIVGEELSDLETIKFIKGKQNQSFEKYAKEHRLREQALSAWRYLENIYASDSLFLTQAVLLNKIRQEQTRIAGEDDQFLEALSKDDYVSWYLPVRKLISSAAGATQYSQEQISSTLADFREMNYADNRLYKSGLLKDAIDIHFLLLENIGAHSNDTLFTEFKLSIDALLQDLMKDEKKLSEVVDYLFDLFEKRSLFKASEYIALKVLNEKKLTIESGLAKQLEAYRSMKKGNIASDIKFIGDNFGPEYTPANFPSSLSNIKSKYKVVVFGASWCPKCAKDIPEISKFYSTWKQQNIEVVFVSLDVDKKAYRSFVKDFPFISTCDFKKWDSPSVKSYYVSGTPTMYLLDEKLEILLRPNSIEHLNAWIDWYLVQKN